MLHQNAIKIQAKGRQRFLVHFWSKEDEFHSKLVGNIEPVKPEKPEPQSPSPNISHLTKPDKARARTFGKTVSPSPKISGPDPTLITIFTGKLTFFRVPGSGMDASVGSGPEIFGLGLTVLPKVRARA